MKKIIQTTIATICTVVVTFSASAQHHAHNNETMASYQAKIKGNSNQKHYGGGFNNHYGNPHYGWNPNVSINFGVGSGYGYTNWNGYNNNYYSSKKAARYALKKSANVIKEALQFSNWNDAYSPWLAKAIRHQQFAKQQYFWGNYAAVINHSERAGFLAWNTLTYFNNSYGYNNNNFNHYDDDFDYQNPYQDPNNPYYRKANSNSSANTEVNNSDEDFGYKINSTQKQNSVQTTDTPSKTQTLKKEELDTQLPDTKVSDKELLKIEAKDLDIE